VSYRKAGKLHIVAVTAVIRNGEGRYLVLKRRDTETAFPGMWGFPGGKVEDNDTIEEALRKEVDEETGLKLKPGKMLLKDASFVRPDGQTVKIFAYLVEAESGQPIRISGDHTDYRWISREDLKTIPHVGIDEELRFADTLYTSGNPLEKLGTKSEKIEKRL